MAQHDVQKNRDRSNGRGFKMLRWCYSKNMISILLYVLLGALLGLIVSQLMQYSDHHHQQSPTTDVMVGAIGAFLGSAAYSGYSDTTTVTLAGGICALMGAMLVLWFAQYRRS